MEGDCNSDNDCMPGLICGKHNCPKDVGYDTRADCCEHVAVVFTPTFAFKKVEGKECNEKKYGEFSDFDEAKLACEGDKTCSSIYDVGCGNQNKYHLCPEDKEKSSSESCVYLKFIVGE